MKKITITDVIARKDEIKDKQKGVVKLYVKSLDGYVTLTKPNKSLYADSIEGNTPIEANIHLVYNSMIEPNLKDKEAQKAFGVHTPKDLLQMIFSVGEIATMSERLAEAAGFGGNAVRVITDDIKN